MPASTTATPTQVLASSFKKQVLELVPVSVSGSSARFKVVYTGTPLPATGDGGNNANNTTGFGFNIKPLSAGLPITLENYPAYTLLYPLGEPNIYQDNSGFISIQAEGASLTGTWPNLSQLPGNILEFSLPYPAGPFAVEITNTASGYAGVIEYSDDPRFPTLIPSTSVGASAINSVGAAGDTVDYFSLFVPTGITYDRVLLSAIAGTGSSSYAIYKAGSVAANAVPVAAGQLASGSAASDVTVGENLLTSGATTTQRLTEGLYTIKIERPTTGSQPSEIAYQLDFSSYIPLPSFLGAEDTPFSINLPTATSTDLALTWRASGLPTGVTLTTTGNQSRLQGQTEANFNGIKTFSLFAKEAGNTTEITYTNLNLTITPVNDAPTLTAINTLNGGVEDTGKTITYAELADAANEADIDDSISFRVESLISGSLQKQVGTGLQTVQVGANGTLLSAGDTFVWTPPVNANGLLDAFAVSAVDASLASTPPIVVKINTAAVNDAPTLTVVSQLNGGTEDTYKEITYDELRVASNAADVDGDTLSFRIETVNSGTLQKGSGTNWTSVTLGSTLLSTGDKLRWQGAQDANGLLDAFSLRVSDGSLASVSPIQVRINTTAVDDAPQLLASSQSFSVLENQMFTTPFTVVNVDANQTVNLSLEGSDANVFTISPSGQLALKQPADYETKQQYTVRVRATDATAAQLSATSDLVLNVLNQPDQRLNLTPTKNGQPNAVFLPTLDTRVTLTGAYSQDAPLAGGSTPASFSSVIAYDGASLNLASSSFSQPGITVSNNDRGASGSSSVTIASNNPSQVSAFQLAFDVESSATGPFTFSWSLAGASAYEQQTNSPVIISPNADVFISNGALNLSSFQTPLSISTEAKTVVLVNQQNVALPYSSPIQALVSTDWSDRIAVNQSIGLDAKGGDDTIDLRPLTSANQPTLVNLLLGAGRDTLQLPLASAANPGSSINVGDFQLGFDRLQLGDGSLLTRRSDVLALATAGQSSQAPAPLDLRFAAVAMDLDPGLKTVVSGTGSLVGSSVALDPGSSGRQLVVRLTPSPTGQGTSTAATLAVANPTALPAGYTWAVTPNGTTATLTLPTSFALATGLSDLRNAVGALVAQAPGTTETGVQVQWLDNTAGVIASEQTTVQINPQLPAGGSTPIKLELQPTGATPAQLVGSTGGDSIHLIYKPSDPSNPSDPKMDKAFGGLGDDLLIAGDGDRLLGGDGADTMIAYRGLGATQLTGGVGDDLLIGGSNDALVGGKGNDTLVVRGLGNRLIGGTGSDLFVLADAAFGPLGSGGAANRILDFGATDRIAFNLPGLQRSDFNLIDSAAGTIIRLSDPWAQRLGSSDLAILQGVKPSAVSAGQLLINQPASSISQSTVSRVDLIDQVA